MVLTKLWKTFGIGQILFNKEPFGEPDLRENSDHEMLNLTNFNSNLNIVDFLQTQIQMCVWSQKRTYSGALAPPRILCKKKGKITSRSSFAATVNFYFSSQSKARKNPTKSCMLDQKRNKEVFVVTKQEKTN